MGEIARNYFARNGTLDNQSYSNLDVIEDKFPVFGIARDLGTVQATQSPVVWAIGYTTDPAISFSDLSGAPATPRKPYYKTKYTRDETMVRVDAISFRRYV